MQHNFKLGDEVVSQTEAHEGTVGEIVSIIVRTQTAQPDIVCMEAGDYILSFTPSELHKVV